MIRPWLLIRLPIDAWPYGRVVGAQDISILSSPDDVDPISKNHYAMEELLHGLGIAVWWWV